MGFKPGQSGNPRGRPAKGRALAEILAKAGNTKVTRRDGKETTRKQMLADMLWEAATTGAVNFNSSDQETTGGWMKVDSMQEWFGIAKFVHQHLDGPVRPEIEMPGAGNISFVLSVVERRDEPGDGDPDGDD